MRDLEFINGLMERDMKGNLLMGIIMDLDFIIGLREYFLIIYYFLSKLNIMVNFDMDL